jgi:choline dehydrogenase-like flavoprotein
VQEIDTDVVVIGSGFGGAMAAHVLVEAGRDVVMLERGAWPMHPAVATAPHTVRELDPYFGLRNAYRSGLGGNGALPGQEANVGGPSLYFAAVSSRFREADFEPAAEIVGDSGAEWPYRYADLEPFYGAAEALLGIAGPATGGVTEPYHSEPYPQQLGPLAATAQRLHGAAARLGLQPYRLPLAINFERENGRTACTACPYCDGFACLIGAKNDIASHVIPRLLRRGLRVEANTAVTRLHAERGCISGIDAVRTRTGEVVRFRPHTVVLAAGAVASPSLLLASGLERVNPAGAFVGRFLMRHCNAHAFGVFRDTVEAAGEFHKQIGLDDFYFGHASIGNPRGKLGSIQQMATPWAALVNLPQRLAPVLARMIDHMTGFLVIAEDQPRVTNRVTVDAGRLDRWGCAVARLQYRNTKRDFAARAALLRQAKRVLREAGAVAHIIWPIRTFSHAVGTLRMGRDPHTSVLDEFGRYRGLDNLFVTDGSVMPTSAGVNPSLTIAANALRTARHIAGHSIFARAHPRAESARPRVSLS